ncbi:MAG TPA: DUF1801 domain-containing protein [Ardenticatenaceae bacterium]|jgi:uncharacterized protein YdhG (YjbR/CyaY superfamily)
MQSEAPDVTTYIQEAPEKRRVGLAALRALCRETLEGYEEGMDYGMPSYKKGGTVEVSFASQKNYISLYILKQEVMDANRDLLQGLNLGKGCIRYTTPARMNFEVIEKLLRESAASSGQIC